MIKRISTGSPFEKTIGFSRAVVDQDMVYVAGTTGYDYDTLTMPEDVGQQTRNTLKTIEKALIEAGAIMADVVRVRYYLTDMADFDAAAAVAGEVFGDIRPAGTFVLAGLIRPEMKIEIEVTARIGAHAS
jgi:enamine deaminase RidA (YjgF/YER057c/UK114 family)